MEGRVWKFMLMERLVGLMEGLDINRSTFPIITLRDRSMEEVHHKDIHTTGPPLGPIYLHSWITRDKIEDNSEQYAMEYNSLSTGIQRKITLEQYCGIKFRVKPKPYHRNNY
jgi:hypothetical protein